MAAPCCRESRAHTLFRALIPRTLLCLVQIAKRQAVVNPENTFFSVKRFIGRKMSEVQEESKQVGGCEHACLALHGLDGICAQRLLRQIMHRDSCTGREYRQVL